MFLEINNALYMHVQLNSFYSLFSSFPLLPRSNIITCLVYFTSIFYTHTVLKYVIYRLHIMLYFYVNSKCTQDIGRINNVKVSIENAPNKCLIQAMQLLTCTIKFSFKNEKFESQLIGLNSCDCIFLENNQSLGLTQWLNRIILHL